MALAWLVQLRRAPGVRLAYGAFVIIGLTLAIGLAYARLGSLILSLTGGFAIVAPAGRLVGKARAKRE